MLEAAGIDPNTHIRIEEVTEEINCETIANNDNTAEDEDFEIEVSAENDERENNAVAVSNTMEYSVTVDNYLENDQVMKDKNENEGQTDCSDGFKRKIGSV